MTQPSPSAQEPNDVHAPTPADLSASAASAVRSAITRGRKRRRPSIPTSSNRKRPRRRRNPQPGDDTDDIVVLRTQPTTPATLVDNAKQLPNRPHSSLPGRTTLIPGVDDLDDGDSNDEWEESIEVDDVAVAAAAEAQAAAAAAEAKRSEKLAASGAQEGNADGGDKDGPSVEDAQVLRERAEELVRRLARRRAAANRKRLARAHSIHLTFALSRLLSLDRAADDDELRALALSAVPADALPSPSPQFSSTTLTPSPSESATAARNNAPSTADTDTRLSKLALWARATLPASAAVQRDTRSPHFSSTICNPSARARHAITSRITKSNLVTATPATGAHPATYVDVGDVATIVTAVLRAVGARARVVASVHPPPAKPTKPQGMVQKKRTTTRHVQAVQEGDNNDSEDGITRVRPKTDSIKNNREADRARVAYYWVEVWVSGVDAWRALDVVDGRLVVAGAAGDVVMAGAAVVPEAGVDTTGEADGKAVDKSPNARENRGSRQQRRVRRLPLREIAPDFAAHAVAAERGILTDVARRYATEWKTVAAARAPGDLFGKVLGKLGRAAETVEEKRAIQLETSELEAFALADGIPTSMAAIQKHPHYVLKRHLKKYEALFPDNPEAAVGELKGELVFPRRNVHVLHTRDRWIRLLREVDDDAVVIKTVKSRGSREEKMVELFGEWQTHDLEIAAVRDGIVPRSVHGNVDLWTAAHLPHGGAHVTARLARVAARRLGVDAAPAMTGFELRRGRSVPRLEGAVVASEHEAVVRELALQLEEQAAARALQRARDEAVAKWGRVLRAVAARQRVQDNYGDRMTYEQRLRAEGEEQLRRNQGLGADESERKGEEARAKREREEAIQRGRERGEGAEHTHQFGKSKPCGDRNRGVWEKRCIECGLRVEFEQL